MSDKLVDGMVRPRNRIRFGLLLCLGFLMVPPSIGKAQTFTHLRSAGGLFVGGLTGDGVSGDGSAVVGSLLVQQSAFRWTRAGGLENLSEPLNGGGFAASYDGSVVVGFSAEPETGFHATVWTDGGAIVLPSIPERRVFEFATSVSDDGSVVAGWTEIVNGIRAFTWTSTAGRIDLGSLPGATSAAAYGVSGDGRVIVGASGSRPFRWTQAAGMVGLDMPPGVTSGSAFAANDDGSIIVGSARWDQTDAAFRWTAGGGMENLGVPQPWDQTSARGVSADGSVIVGQLYRVDELNNPIYSPFLWTRELGLVDLGEYLASLGLDLTGWTLMYATGVSADGRTIVGNGEHNGELEGWVLTLANCPADFNHDLTLTSQDFFAFLNAFFEGAASADFNRDGAVNSSDVFDYLGSFFGGCP